MPTDTPFVIPPVWAQAPRYLPGRELPRYRFVPGQYPHPRTHPEGSLYGAADAAPGLAPDRWREDETYLWGVDLYHRGFLWESHESWEGSFFAAVDGVQRRFIQSLIQIAAAELQAHRGIGRGVRTFAQRIDARLDFVAREVGTERYMGVDVPQLLADFRRHFAPALGTPGAADSGDARVIGLAPHLDLGPDPPV